MATSTVELVSMAEYARRRGCTEGAVRKAVADKRITLAAGKVDPVAADAQWARNTRVRAGSHAANEPTSPTSPLPDAPGEERVSYDEARRRREAAEAAIAELRLRETTGELVRADAIRSALARRAATFREALLQIPARLSAQLVAETDQAAVHALLEHELRATMAHLTDAA